MAPLKVPNLVPSLLQLAPAARPIASTLTRYADCLALAALASVLALPFSVLLLRESVCNFLRICLPSVPQCLQPRARNPRAGTRARGHAGPMQRLRAQEGSGWEVCKEGGREDETDSLRAFN